MTEPPERRPGLSAAGGELSFLARPGEVCDWRMLLAHGAAAEAGVLAALPGTPGELATRLSLDEHAVRVLLEQLAAWDIVEADHAGRYGPGSAAPTPDQSAMLRQHAWAIRHWANQLDDRLHGITQPAGRHAVPARLEILFDFLAANARRLAPAVVDACLARFPQTRRILDLGGAHGEYSLEFTRRGLDATVQDLPDVIELHEARLAKAGIDRFAGDFFERLPKGPFDLVFCAGVAPTYGAERNRALYRQITPVLAPGGGLAIVTFLRGRNRVAPTFAVQMLVISDQGDTHSEEDYRRWLDEAGYHSVDVVDFENRPHSLLMGQR